MEHYTRSVGLTPDQNGCIVTDEVHDPISNKLCRGGAPLAASIPMRAHRSLPFHRPKIAHSSNNRPSNAD